MRMINFRGRIFWKYFAYFVLLLLAAVLQSTPNFLSIAGVQPVLVIPAVVLIAMTEPIIPAAVFGLLGGLFLDAGSLSIFGLFGFEFLFLATFANLFVTVILRFTWFSYTLFCFIFSAIFISLKFVFYYGMWGYAGAGAFYLTSILWAIAYTTLVSFLIYWAWQKARRKWNKA